MGVTDLAAARLGNAIRAILPGRRRDEAGTDVTELEIVARSGLFDPAYYLEMYPDVAASGIDPLEHYLRHGADEGRNPNRLFETRFYLDSNPDVAASGLNPLRHFCEFGWREGRNPSAGFDLRRYAAMVRLPDDCNPLLHRLQNPTDAERPRSDAEVFGGVGLFDAAFYLSRYPDVARSGADPLDHFVQYGAKEGRDPCALFDSVYYLQQNPDVARAGMAPFRHFCLYGWRELRDPSPAFDISRYWLEHMLPAAVQGNPLAHYGSVGRVCGLQLAQVGTTGPAEREQLADRAEAALDASEHSPETLEMLGQALANLARWPTAETAFRRALAERWESARLHARLAETLEKQGKWWQAAESLEQATARDGRRAGWFYRLGDAHEKMSRLEAAVEAFRRALVLSPDVSKWHYRLGCALERLELQQEANACYARAITLDGRADVARFGVGYLHQERGHWPEAAAAYAGKIGEEPLDAALRYRLGMALDRCYRWPEAQAAYEEAIALAPHVAYWHYRLGFVLERQQQWDAAADAYAAGVLLSDNFMPDWSYRQGYVLQKAGRFEEACLAYLSMRRDAAKGPAGLADVRSAGGRMDEYLRRFARPTMVEAIRETRFVQAEPHVALARQYELACDWGRAAEAYQLALERSDEHVPDLHFKHGEMLVKAGRQAEACMAFERTRIFSKAYGVRVDETMAAKDVAVCYGEFSNLRIVEKTIVYESYHGKSLGCNPGAIFRCLVNSPDFADWKHVWAIAKNVEIPQELLSHKNVVFVRRNSPLYACYLATASHLISNNTFPWWFSRRPEQKFLNTWHGTPLKALGKDINDEFMAHQNAARNLLHATHVISPNEHTSNALVVRNDILGTFSGLLAEIGYPRIDRTLNISPEERASLFRALNLRPDLPVVLYAPTWRGSLGRVVFDESRLVEALDEMSGLHCQVLFRGHHLTQELLRTLDISATIVPDGIDTNELLAIVDVLVTDYSSIFFDFLPLRRPILFFTYDLDQYINSRGLYLDMSELPGVLCRDKRDLGRELQRCLKEKSSHSYDAAVAIYCPHEDGRATERTIGFFFRGESQGLVTRYQDKREKILMYAGGFIPNGITSSFLNLLNNLDAQKYSITVVIDPSSVSGAAERLAKFKQLPSHIQVLGKTGSISLNPEEAWVASQFKKREGRVVEEMFSIYGEAYRKEYERCFGQAPYDFVIQFDGYLPYWTSVFAFASGRASKIIYLHNDMQGELETRFPFLTRIFHLYGNYNRLLSVSSSVHEANKTNLARLGIPSDRFCFSNNLIDVDRIRAYAREPLTAEISDWVGSSTLLGTLGRLSPEKGHRKLLHAFRRVLEETGLDLKLVIAGEGPLRQELQECIEELHLTDRVLLSGLLCNPYPLLRRMDLFVFPSDYEGQGIAVLEALVLGKPVVATDVVGPRTVLEGGYGMLVENNEKGLAAGIKAYFMDREDYRSFDAVAYQAEALKKFTSILDGSSSRRPVILAARADGLGERMNAILNGLYLAQTLGLKFSYWWPRSGSWEKLGGDGSTHAIVPQEQFFAQSFIDKYGMAKAPAIRFSEIGCGMSHEALLEGPASSYGGWAAPRVDLRGLLPEELWPVHGLGFIFDQIEFSGVVQAAIEQARAVELPDGCVALHLRSGDIFYGPYRKLVNYTYKGITLPIAKAIIRKLKENGGSILVFGQDREVLQYLKEKENILLLDDLPQPGTDVTEARAMYEIVLMSRCKEIVAGSSGFARLASWIGNVQVRQPKDFFDPTEQADISIADLSENSDVYHPLQTAFAYWYAYFYGRHLKSFELSDKLLSQAAKYDPENQLYPLKRAANCFRHARYIEGDQHLCGLLLAEYMEIGRLPALDLLVSRTLGAFNLAEDFPAFAKAALEGHPWATLCHYVIAKAAGDHDAMAQARGFLQNAHPRPEFQELCKFLGV